VVGLSFAVLPNTNLLLATTSGVEKLVLLIEVKMANSESGSKETTCNLLGHVSAIPHSVLTLSLLVAARCDEEVFINPCELASLGSVVTRASHDFTFGSGIEVHHFTALADNTKSLAVRVPSHGSAEVGQIFKHHSGLLVFDIPDSHGKI